jgi:hypothetical protein
MLNLGWLRKCLDLLLGSCTAIVPTPSINPAKEGPICFLYILILLSKLTVLSNY